MSLKHITSSNVSLDDRFRLHREASARIKTAAEELGLKQVVQETAFEANGMTAVGHYYDEDQQGIDIVDKAVLPRRSQGIRRYPFTVEAKYCHCWRAAQGHQGCVFPLPISYLRLMNMALLIDKYFRIGYAESCFVGEAPLIGSVIAIWGSQWLTSLEGTSTGSSKD
jgi:hypothetical protein